MSLSCSSPVTNKWIASSTSKAALVDTETTNPALGSSLYRLGNRYGKTYNDYYLDVVQPLIAKRCVVCHSCTNGPCSLNMTSYKALERGLSKDDAYYLFRLKPGFDTRISNNFSTEKWRQRNFISILPGAEPGVLAKQSVLYRNIERGQQNTASNAAFNEAEIRRMVAAHEKSKYECPVNQKEYAAFEQKYPLGGMPCALPALEPAEAKVLLDWVETSAPGPAALAEKAAKNPETTAASRGDAAQIVAAWERFLNPEDLAGQLVSRYIYEHVYIANIELEENPGEFYRIVRSHAPMGEEIVQISTETPQDDPGPGRVYYRMQKVDRVIEAKTHIPWRLKQSSIEHFRQLFFAEGWSISLLPGYEDKNPFAVFEAIPARARSDFMRENAWLLVQSIARGPVCFKQEHTYGVDNYFWVLQLKADSDPTVVYPKLGLSSWDQFYAKKPLKSSLPFDVSLGERQYRAAFETKLRSMLPRGLSLDDIWDGGVEHNPNALVAVRRFQYSVDAWQGQMKAIGGMPKSILLLSYASFERRYYNEVVQFKYWDTLVAKLATWDWAVYLRTESEDLYVSLFTDQKVRDELRKKLTGPVSRNFYWLASDYARGRPSATGSISTEDQMLRAILRHLGHQVVGETDTLNNWPESNLSRYIPAIIENTAQWESGLRTLTGRTAPFAQFVPNIVYIRLGGSELYSLSVHRGYLPNKIILAEPLARRRKQDMVLASRGMTGVAPELFFDLSYQDAAPFLRQFANVKTLENWQAFSHKFKISRNSPRFWPFVDWLHDWEKLHMPTAAGILELKLYDKDDMPY